MMIYISNKF